jgi:hypothetical protein
MKHKVHEGITKNSKYLFLLKLCDLRDCFVSFVVRYRIVISSP